jgi:hypothetical protein
VRSIIAFAPIAADFVEIYSPCIAILTAVVVIAIITVDDLVWNLKARLRVD